VGTRLEQQLCSNRRSRLRREPGDRIPHLLLPTAEIGTAQPVTTVVQFYPSEDTFFMVEEAAEAAAEAAVNRMHSSKAQLATAAFAVAVAGVAYVATRPRVRRAVAELFAKPAKAESV
jgi:hypothetical protein